MAEICMAFYDEAPDGLQQKYAVIIARYGGRLLWCRHRDRQTWEIPGGHIEPGESAMEAATRELQEETGATDFTLQPVCWYSAWRADSMPHSCGLLCVADVHALGDLHNEIAEVRPFDGVPDALTYPDIQPRLFEEINRRKNT
jgi:8-oxo-dGTP diphosphatase